MNPSPTSRGPYRGVRTKICGRCSKQKTVNQYSRRIEYGDVCSPTVMNICTQCHQEQRALKPNADWSHMPQVAGSTLAF